MSLLFCAYERDLADSERTQRKRRRRSRPPRSSTSSVTSSGCAARSSAAASASAAPARSSSAAARLARASRRCRRCKGGDHDARRSRDARAAASHSAGVHRRAGRAMRLLPQRRHPHGQGLPGSEPSRRMTRAAAGDERRAVPLLRARPHVQGDPPVSAAGGPTMTPAARAALGVGGILAKRLSARRRRAHRHVLRDRRERRRGLAGRARARRQWTPASSTRGLRSPPTAASPPTPASASSDRECRPRNSS